MTSDEIDAMSDEEYKNEYEDEYEEEEDKETTENIHSSFKKNELLMQSALNAPIDDDDDDDDDVININAGNWEEENVKEKELLEVEILKKFPVVKQNNLMSKGQDTYNNRILTYEANEQANMNIAYKEKSKNNMFELNGQVLLDKINKDGKICLWKYKNNFYYRSAQGNEIHKGNKNYISEQIQNFLHEAIKIVTYKEISKNDLIKQNFIEKYIFTYQIPAIEAEIFAPKEGEFFNINGRLHRNLFPYTKYLEKRFQNIQNKDGSYDSFIIDFLENIANEATQNNDRNDKPITVAMLNWISFFFQKMESSNIALVLHGSQEIAVDVFWIKLIIPIFGDEQNCITIDDDMLKLPIHKIVTEKIFFHIADFTTTEENIKKINQLLKGILIDKYVLSDSTPPTRIPVYGQVLISTEKAISHMNQYYSQFEYIRIQDEFSIVNNLADNINDLLLKFTEDELDIFSTYLATFYKNDNKGLTVVSKIDILSTETSIVSIDSNIDAFIRAIKTSDEKYFEKVSGVTDKKGNDIYQQLMHAFTQDDGYFIGQDLYLYYNAVYGEDFKTNKALMDELKAKDEIFKQETRILKILTKEGNEEVLFQAPSSSKSTGGKALYKISNYTMADKITIPSGATVISSQDNIEKYNLEDSENAIKLWKEYKKNK